MPVLLFLAALVQCDGYKLLRLRMVLAVVAAGALAAGASYLLNNWAYAHFPGDFQAYSRYVSPWIEESLKAALLVFLIRTRRVGLPVDAGIAGFAIGTGFALVENLYYLASRPDTALPVQVIRGFGTAIMHGGTATVLAMISDHALREAAERRSAADAAGLSGGGGAAQRASTTCSCARRWRRSRPCWCCRW